MHAADEEHLQMTGRTCFDPAHGGISNRGLFSETPTRVPDEIVAPDADAAAATTTHSAAEPSIKEGARRWDEVTG